MCGTTFLMLSFLDNYFIIICLIIGCTLKLLPDKLKFLELAIDRFNDVKGTIIT